MCIHIWTFALLTSTSSLIIPIGFADATDFRHLQHASPFALFRLAR